MDPITLTPEEQQRKAIQDALLAKFASAQDNSAVEAAQDQARRAQVASGVGRALEGLARSASNARGGQAVDSSFYDNIAAQGNQAVKDAIMRRQMAQQDVMSGLKLGQEDLENKRSDRQETRAERTLSNQESNYASEAKARDAAMGREAQRLELEKQKLSQEGIDKELMRALKEKEIAGKQGEQGRKESLDLTEKYMSHPVTKNTNTVLESYAKIKDVSSKKDYQTGAGDLALIFSYMKILDPGSTVREGEAASAANAGGVGNRIMNLYNEVLAGKKLTPDVRNEFLGTADTLARAQLQQQERIRGEYGDIAARYNLNKDQVLGKTPELPPMSKASPEDQAAMDWAKANANDPRAVKIMEKLKAKGL